MDNVEIKEMPEQAGNANENGNPQGGQPENKPKPPKKKKPAKKAPKRRPVEKEGKTVKKQTIRARFMEMRNEARKKAGLPMAYTDEEIAKEMEKAE